MMRLALTLSLVLATTSLAGATSYDDDAQPILSDKCGPCHTTSNSGDQNIGTSYADGQAESSVCDEGSVAECSVARIEDGTMPLGQGCGGAVADDAENAGVCVTESELAVLKAWLEAGAPETAAAGGCETDDDCNEGEVCTDAACVDDGGDVVMPGECETDADCDDDGTCVDGACQDTGHGQAECNDDMDCGEGGTCSGEVCIPAGIDDSGSETGGGGGASDDGGGCQGGDGPLGSLMLALALAALVVSRRRSVLDE